MASFALESMASSKVEVKPPMLQKFIAVLFFSSALSGCFVFSSSSPPPPRREVTTTTTTSVPQKETTTTTTITCPAGTRPDSYGACR